MLHRIAAEIGSDAPSAIAAAVTERLRGSTEEGRNLTNFIDFLYLPGRKAQTYYINEGLLSTLPAVALPLFGALAGMLLKRKSVAPGRKSAWMAGAGATAVAAGWLWSLQFPVIKRIWTSSFVLVSGGCSAMLMAAFYWIVDVRRWRRWCRPFVWVGCNALTIYLLAPIVNFRSVATRLVGGDVQILLDRFAGEGTGGLVIAVAGLLLAVALMRFLYKRQIFLRV